MKSRHDSLPGAPCPVRPDRLIARRAILWAALVLAAGWLSGTRERGGGRCWAAELPPPGSRALKRIDPPACATDVWVVSTRRLGGVGGMPFSAPFGVERHVGGDTGGSWQPADAATCVGASERPLVIFIHGNRYDAAAAKSQGVLLARRLTELCPTTGPVQTVIFSWPSGQQGILLKDGRAKYDRARVDGHYLARILADVPPQRPVAVVGYSFGALIALEALDDLVTADRQGRGDAPSWTDRPGRTHLVFVAPAVRCDAFAPRGRYRHTLAGLDRLALVINSRDHALKFFPWLERESRADALGTTGMPRSWMPPETAFEATDAAGIIGRQHGLPLYLASGSLAGRIASGVLTGLDH